MSTLDKARQTKLVFLTSPSEVNEELIDWIKTAFQSAG
jgi:hypothetical protein